MSADRLTNDDLAESVKAHGADSGVGLMASELLAARTWQDTAREVLAEIKAGRLVWTHDGWRWHEGDRWWHMADIEEAEPLVALLDGLDGERSDG
jgi:hypothetical protein